MSHDIPLILTTHSEACHSVFGHLIWTEEKPVRCSPPSCNSDYGQNWNHWPDVSRVRALPHGVWRDALYNRKSKENRKDFLPKPVEHCHPDRSNCCTDMLAYHLTMKTAAILRTWPLQDFATQKPTWRGADWTGWPSSGFAIWRRTKTHCYLSTGWQMISSNWKSKHQTLGDDRRPLA